VPTSLVAAVAHRTGASHTLFLCSAIARNRVGKLELYIDEKPTFLKEVCHLKG